MEAIIFGVCKKGIGSVAQWPDADGCVGDGRQEDGSGDGLTGPNFGCIHFLPNDQAEPRD